MKYVGIHTQQRRNNFYSLLLLCLFPCLVVGLCYLFAVFFTALSLKDQPDAGAEFMPLSGRLFANIVPYITAGVAVWFAIAYFFHASIIGSATGARPLERKENKRVYNLVENLCMAQGMKMPAVNVLEDTSLNAFASGINNRTYAVTLSRGLIDRLEDDELQAVIAHELSHIRQRDVRLLIVSIVFVGIFAMIAQAAVRWLYYAPRSSSRNGKGNSTLPIILLVLVVAVIGYLFSIVMRFAISRKREYLADAGAAEMTRNPQALALALRKISSDPDIEAVHRSDVAQLFIEHPGAHAKGFLDGFGRLFATHPPIEKRIQVLEQF